MIDVDPRSTVPLYLQIADRLRRLIALGALRPGERLPTIREIALEARVNRNTAARAIQLLEGDGVVRTRVGQGTFVEDRAATTQRSTYQAELDAGIDRAIAVGRAAGLDFDAILERCRQRIEVGRRDGDGLGDGETVEETS